MKNIPFNINENIRVKLNDLGHQRRANLYNEYIGIIPNRERRNMEYYKKQSDKDGYTTFQMWHFMELFGEVTGIGKPDYYDSNILINNT